MRSLIDHRTHRSDIISSFDVDLRLDWIEHLRQLRRSSTEFCPFLFLSLTTNSITRHHQSLKTTRSSSLSSSSSPLTYLIYACECERRTDGERSPDRFDKPLETPLECHKERDEQSSKEKQKEQWTFGMALDSTGTDKEKDTGTFRSTKDANQADPLSSREERTDGVGDVVSSKPERSV